MFFFRGGESRARAAEHRVGVFDALGKRIELRAQSGDTLIEALKLQKLWNCGVHEGRSLDTAKSGFFRPQKNKARRLFHRPASETCPRLSGVFPASDKRVNQIADADGERNESEGSRGHRVALGRDSCNRGERRDVTDGSADA